MQIILLQDIKGIGKKFDVKEIKDGYARNFLLPRGLIKIADEKSTKELEIKKASHVKREEKLKALLESAAKDLSERKFVFSLNVGKKGETFGSITKEDIKERICSKIDQLNSREKEIEIKIEKPLKTLGEHQIEINLGKGVKSQIKIKIEPLS